MITSIKQLSPADHFPLEQRSATSCNQNHSPLPIGTDWFFKILRSANNKHLAWQPNPTPWPPKTTYLYKEKRRLFRNWVSSETYGKVAVYVCVYARVCLILLSRHSKMFSKTCRATYISTFGIPTSCIPRCIHTETNSNSMTSYSACPPPTSP